MGEPVIIGCGKGKRDTPSPAIDLYTGTHLRCAVRWARSVTDEASIFILSAKHGLIPGGQVIAPYRASWSTGGFAADGRPAEPTVDLATLAEQITTHGITGRVITLAGEAYRVRLRAASARMVEPYNPFAALAKRRWGDARTGYQARLMNEHHGTIPTLTGATR